jgi:chaperonin cofactor prefoldin
MTLDSASNLGLGITPSAFGYGGNMNFIGGGRYIASTSDDFRFGANVYNDGSVEKYASTGNAELYRLANGTHQWYYAASGSANATISFTEAMRIDSSGHLLVGNTAPVTAVNYYKAYIQGGTYANSNSTALTDQKCGLYLYNNEGGATNNEAANNALVIAINQGGSVTPANMITGYAAYPTATRTFQVNISGSVYNYLGVYGTLSDQKVKQDIVDASSQWQDIKNVRVRKYRLKSEVERNENAPSFIGVVAQELEQTSPNLVDSPEGCETDENVFKTVKTSILQMKSLKALQEAMERIETLETKVTELLAR